MKERKGRFTIIKDLIQAFFKENKTPYKLVEIIDRKGKKYAVFRVNGSRLTFKKEINEAVSDDSLMVGLGYKDVRNISFYTMFQKMRHQYEIDSIDMNTDSSGFVKIKDLKNSLILKVPLEQLGSHKDILRLTRGEDLYTIGYIHGSTEK